MRVVIYLRMSTDEQDASIVRQREAVRRYAKQHGYVIVREYIDEGISGDATDKRLGFLALHKAACGKRDFEAILVWDIDRFGRFDSLEAGFWIHPLRQAGVALISVNEGPVDWGDFTGRVMYSIKQEGKHQFLRDLSRNVMSGMMQKAKDGDWSSGKPPLGYRRDDGGKIVLGEPHQVAIVREVFAEYLRGKSLRSLAEFLNLKGLRSARGNLWSSVTVRTILTNERYCGDFIWNERNKSKYHRLQKDSIAPLRVNINATTARQNDRQNWVVIRDAFPAIIDRAQFAAVQAALESRQVQSTPHPDGGRFVLTGLLRCAQCGSRMSGLAHGKYIYYACSGYLLRGASFCRRNSVSQDELTGYIVRAIEHRYLNPATIKEIRSQLRETVTQSAAPSTARASVQQLSAVRKELAKAERNMALGTDALRPRYERVVAELAAKEADLAAAVAVARTPRKQALAAVDAEIDAAVHRFSEMRTVIQRAGTLDQRRLLHSVIERIVVKVSHREPVQRKRFWLVGGEIEFKPYNLLATPFHSKQVIRFKAG